MIAARGLTSAYGAANPFRFLLETADEVSWLVNSPPKPQDDGSVLTEMVLWRILQD
jgi:hypothetical protein